MLPGSEKICWSAVRPGSMSGSVLNLGCLVELRLSPVDTKIHAIQSFDCLIDVTRRSVGLIWLRFNGISDIS